MKTNIIILGAHGMLGWQIVNEFKDKNYKITCQVRNKKSELSLKKKLNLKKKIKFIYFDVEKDPINLLLKHISVKDVIINCIGKIKPYIKDNSKEQIYSAIKVNSLFPIELSKYIKLKKNKLYQIATDCVYDGKKGNYDENSCHNAIDIYGKTKSLGEVKDNNFYNIRVSIIGKELNTKNSLVEWFISNKKKKKILGFNDHLWNGVSTNVFAHILYTIINKNIKIPCHFHLIPKNTVNKFVLLNYLKKYFGFINLKIIKINSKTPVNRVLKTKYKLLNHKIWSESKYKKILSISEIVKTL